jgi:hypothetical protein
MRWLKEGDACTKFFHLHANHRRRKNRIDSLLVDGVTLVAEADKAEAAFKYYDAILGFEFPRTPVLDFSELGLPVWIFRSLVVRSLRRRCGLLFRTFLTIRRQALMGSMVVSTGRPGRSSKRTW